MDDISQELQNLAISAPVVPGTGDIHWVGGITMHTETMEFYPERIRHVQRMQPSLDQIRMGIYQPQFAFGTASHGPPTPWGRGEEEEAASKRLRQAQRRTRANNTAREIFAYGRSIGRSGVSLTQLRHWVLINPKRTSETNNEYYRRALRGSVTRMTV